MTEEMNTKPYEPEITRLLEDARERLARLSPVQLKVASDFLAYLDEREQTEAAEELLEIAGIEEAYKLAVEEA